VNPKPFRIIPCSTWGARPPKHPNQIVSAKPVRAIFHHTAGHALGAADGESYQEAVNYCKSIQNYHMSQGWNDTGQNFTVTRNGYIFEGRHGSLEQVGKGKMVVSAHCPGQNEQPGVEIEHLGNENMTAIQREATVWLFAWICKRCSIPASHIYGHRDYFATSCPGNLYAQLPQFRIDVGKVLNPPKPKPPPKISGHWQVTKTFYDGHTTTENTGALRVWSLRQGNLVKKGVRDVRAHWVETA
jgi:hypothetical protein